MNAAQALAAMHTVVDAPGYAYLRDYRRDFEVHDRELLERTWHPQARYLWAVREYGTHLCLLGVHERMNNEARAVLDHLGSNDRSFEVYLLSAQQGLQRVTTEQARSATLALDYQVQQQTVWHEGAPLAQFTLTPIVSGAKRDARVDYTACSGFRHSHGHRVALLAIAQSMAVQHWQSLFAHANQVNLDGRCLYDMLQRHVSQRDNAQSQQAPKVARAAARERLTTTPRKPVGTGTASLMLAV